MKTFDPTADISNDEALAIIRDILENGIVSLSTHARARMRSRHFNMNDVRHILNTGDIRSKEFNDLDRTWKYRIEGDDIEAEAGVVITAIISSDRQVVITVF